MTPSSGTTAIPPLLRPRLQMTAALARERLQEVHFRYAMELIDHAKPLVDPERAVGIYTRLHGLRGLEASDLRHKIFVALGRRPKTSDPAADGETEAASPQSIFGQIRRRLRGRVNTELRQWVEYHTGRAQTELLWAHVENVLQFIDLLEAELGMAGAVELYAGELGVPASRTEIIYHMALATRSARNAVAAAAPQAIGDGSAGEPADANVRSLPAAANRRGAKQREAS